MYTQAQMSHMQKTDIQTITEPNLRLSFLVMFGVSLAKHVIAAKVAAIPITANVKDPVRRPGARKPLGTPAPAIAVASDRLRLAFGRGRHTQMPESDESKLDLIEVGPAAS
eukprot:CAMPEP_0177328426 /NCGR_PEP_ID=MMETSP0368-20130122/19422_1 /TAXON_ID=447022 ORGANISM="Scrippsiella hangoei-like, Strain SHHI-4" /NCGR_SAMPLE_ID=MMETSP0368 /ASSEMBLY_ACC=CAM_ASM_000363 /LENGTH=110 /DNA_ID=CAMNT_0018788563 /DNA_START=154 /DNA_END=483 /DNA_ORIENTATION=+